MAKKLSKTQIEAMREIKAKMTNGRYESWFGSVSGPTLSALVKKGLIELHEEETQGCNRVFTNYYYTLK